MKNIRRLTAALLAIAMLIAMAPMGAVTEGNLFVSENELTFGRSDSEREGDGQPAGAGEPTASPTAEPTASPTAEPTVSPTANPPSGDAASDLDSPVTEPGGIHLDVLICEDDHEHSAACYERRDLFCPYADAEGNIPEGHQHGADEYHPFMGIAPMLGIMALAAPVVDADHNLNRFMDGPLLVRDEGGEAVPIAGHTFTFDVAYTLELNFSFNKPVDEKPYYLALPSELIDRDGAPKSTENFTCKVEGGYVVVEFTQRGIGLLDSSNGGQGIILGQYSCSQMLNKSVEENLKQITVSVPVPGGTQSVTIYLSTNTTPPALTKKTGVWDRQNRQFVWTIVIEPGSNPNQPVRLVDTFIEGNMHVTQWRHHVLDGEISATDADGGAVAFDVISNGQKGYTLEFPSIKKTTTVSYRTKWANPLDYVRSTYEGSTHWFGNTAQLFEQNGTTPIGEQKTGSVSVVTDMISKVPQKLATDEATKKLYAIWQVTLWVDNSKNASFDLPEGTKMVDVMPKGMSLKDVYRLDGSTHVAMNYTLDASRQIITVDVSAATLSGLTDRIYIETWIDDTGVINNGAAQNTAYLFVPGAGSYGAGPSSGRNIDVVMIKKAAVKGAWENEGYVHWTITANPNGETLSNVVVRDRLEERLEFISVTCNGKTYTPQSGGAEFAYQRSAKGLDCFAVRLGDITQPVTLNVVSRVRKEKWDERQTASLLNETDLFVNADRGISEYSQDGIPANEVAYTAKANTSIDQGKMFSKYLRAGPNGYDGWSFDRVLGSNEAIFLVEGGNPYTDWSWQKETRTIVEDSLPDGLRIAKKNGVYQVMLRLNDVKVGTGEAEINAALASHNAAQGSISITDKSITMDCSKLQCKYGLFILCELEGEMLELGKHSATNSAVVYNAAYPGGSARGSATVSVENTAITKTGREENGVAIWTCVINPSAGPALINAEDTLTLEDTLQNGLTMLGTGPEYIAITDESGASVPFSAQIDGQHLTISGIPASRVNGHRLTLIFKTRVDKTGNYTNTISMSAAGKQWVSEPTTSISMTKNANIMDDVLVGAAIVKVDANDPTVKLAGVKFELYKSTAMNTKLFEGVTNAEGRLTIDASANPRFLIPGHEYFLKEVTTPACYKPSSQPFFFTPGKDANIFTVTNEPQTVHYAVEKVWQDDDDAEGIRPGSINVRLMDGAKQIDSVTLSDANGWRAEFKELRKYKQGATAEIPANEIVYTYTVQEDLGGAGGDYQLVDASSLTTPVRAGDVMTFTLTNKLVKGTVDLEFTKVWDVDGIGAYLPEGGLPITLNGYIEGRIDPISTANYVVPHATGFSWVYPITGLPEKYGGKPISYRVSETLPKPGGNDVFVPFDGNAVVFTNGEATITNRLSKFRADVVKNWEEPAGGGNRPSTLVVTFRDRAGRMPPVDVELTGAQEASVWTASAELPVYDPDGNRIEWYVKEDSVPHGYAVSYAVSAGDGGGFDMNVPGHEGIATAVLTNARLTGLSVVKHWDFSMFPDVTDPESYLPVGGLDIHLYGYVDGVLVDALTRHENIQKAARLEWTYAFDGLPATYGGKPVTYKVKEDMRALDESGNYWFQQLDESGAMLDQGVDSTEYGFDARGVATITNRIIPGTTSVAINKRWDDYGDADDIRPDAIRLQLYRTGYAPDALGQRTAEALVADEPYGEPINFVPADPTASSWTFEMGGLPKYGKSAGGVKVEFVYGARELNVDSSYTSNASGVTVPDGGMMVNRLVLTNRIGNHVWIDENRNGVQDDGETPVEGVPVMLYRVDGGTLVSAGSTVTDGTGWYQFTGLEPGDYVVSFPSTLTLPEGGEQVVYELIAPNLGGDPEKDSNPKSDGRTAEIRVGASTDDQSIDAGYRMVMDNMIGDYVWIDLDGDGIQDPGETPVEGVTVELYAVGEESPRVTVTDQTGWYEFRTLEPFKNYVVKFPARLSLAGGEYVLTQAGQGAEGEDSNPGMDGYTPEIYVEQRTVDITIDAGYVLNSADIEIVKLWQDAEGVALGADVTDGLAEVQFRLSAVTAISGESVALSAAQSAGTLSAPEWTASIQGLPVWHDGELVRYSVSEPSVQSGFAFASAAPSNATLEGRRSALQIELTNREDNGQGRLSITKRWLDMDGEPIQWPQGQAIGFQILVYEYGTEDEVTLPGFTTSGTLDADNPQYTTLAPKYQAGRQLEYRVREVFADSNYTADGRVVAVELVSGDKNVEFENRQLPREFRVRKQWADASGYPEQLSVEWTLHRIGAGGADETVEIDQPAPDADGWYVYRNLPRYYGENSEGEYSYYAVEAPMAGYQPDRDRAEDGDTLLNTRRLTEISGTKTWDDQSNVYSTRRSVRLTLAATPSVAFAGGEAPYVELSGASDSEEFAFRNLPMYVFVNGGFERVRYEIVETSDTLGYDGSVTQPDMSEEQTSYAASVTNALITRGFAAKKVWLDQLNNFDTRPAQLVVNLIDAAKPGVVLGSVTLSEANDWTQAFPGEYPEYAAGATQPNQRVRYAVVEVTLTPDYVASQAVGTGEDGVTLFTLTNVLTAEGELLITKRWTLDAGYEALRMDPLTVTVTGHMADGSTFPAGTVALSANSAAPWSSKLTGLKLIGDDGDPITYTVEEAPQTAYQLVAEESYQPRPVDPTDPNSALEAQLTNALRTGSIRVIKRWQQGLYDAEDRPELRLSLHQVLGDADVVLDEDAYELERETLDNGDDAYTFSGLPMTDDTGAAFEYYVTEQQPTGYEQPTYRNTDSANDLTGAYDGGVIINARRRIRIEVEKTWQDDLNNIYQLRAPVTIGLSSVPDVFGGSPAQSTISGPDANGLWTTAFEDLPQYAWDGTGYALVQYKIGEVTKLERYELQPVEQPVMRDDQILYRVTLTNKLLSISVEGEKTWLDTGLMSGVSIEHPDQITVTLRRVDGQPINLPGAETVKTVGEAQQWKWSFDGLPGSAEEYYVEEAAVDGYLPDDAPDMNITNTPVLREYSVEKIWEGDSEDIRPTTLMVTLRSEPAKVLGVGVSYPLTKDDRDVAGRAWTHTFRALPSHTFDGGQMVPVRYYVEEQPLNGYTAARTDGDQITTLTNQLATIDITLVKTWEGEGGAGNAQRRAVDVQLRRRVGTESDEPVATKTLRVVSGTRQQLVFTGLPQYRMTANADGGVGEPYTYYIVESPLPSYRQSDANAITIGLTTDYTIRLTNTYRAVNLAVTKVWDDIGNAHNTRPASVRVYLTRNGQRTQTYASIARGRADQSAEFRNLPAEDENGPIAYGIQEEPVPGYASRVGAATYNAATRTYAIRLTNTLDITQLTRTLTINKHWANDESSAAFRPESVRLTLEGATSSGAAAISPVSLTLSASLNWTATVRDLPIYDGAGNEIAYTISEHPVPGYEAEYAQPRVDESGNLVADVTNTLVPTMVRVIKNWRGVSRASAPSVWISLYADGTLISTHEFGADNFDQTFENLPMYNGRTGQQIVYRAIENTAQLPANHYYAGTTTTQPEGYAAQIVILNEFSVAPVTPPVQPMPPGVLPIDFVDGEVPLSSGGYMFLHLGDCFD